MGYNIFRFSIMAILFAFGICIGSLFTQCDRSGNGLSKNGIVIGGKVWKPIAFHRGAIIHDTVVDTVYKEIKSKPQFVHDTTYLQGKDTLPASVFTDKFADTNITIDIHDIVGNRTILDRKLTYKLTKRTVTSSQHDTLFLAPDVKKKRWALSVGPGVSLMPDGSISPTINATVGFKLVSW
jgi:hypothetical protein